jgi:hypothetical protein
LSTLELFVSLHPSVIRERLDRLKKLQSMLGSINDLETVHDMALKEHASMRLCAELMRRRDRRVEEFASRGRAELALLGSAAQWNKDLSCVLRSRGLRGKPPARSELDETPIGNFLELEGSPRWIDRTARLLGFSSSDYINRSYGYLYLAFCRERRIRPKDMLFKNGERKK